MSTAEEETAEPEEETERTEDPGEEVTDEQITEEQTEEPTEAGEQEQTNNATDVDDEDDDSECKGPEYCPARGGTREGFICRRKGETIFEWFANWFTTHRYYWDILKSTIMFLIALKVARECMMLKIPMKEYKPFNRCIL